MKKLTALLLCFLLLCSCCVSVVSADAGDNNTVISATVPDTHKVTIVADNAKVSYDGTYGVEFDVPRLSSPKFVIRPNSGRTIKTVTLNGVDVTNKVKNNSLTLDPVYEEKIIVITTDTKPYIPPKSYNITISAGNATVFYEGESGERFTVPAESKPTLFIEVDSGKVVKSVTVNGKDVTDKLVNGYLILDEIDQDVTVTVITEDAPTPDAPTPDAPTPDAPTPDAPTPDNPTPDDPTPDDPTPDDPTPDNPAKPETHKITVSASDSAVFYEGESRQEFSVTNESTPRILIRAESGKVIKSVTLNGEDVTSQLYGGYLQLGSVLEDVVLVVTTEDEPTVVAQTYTVTGIVTLNGKPLSNVKLELRSTLKTCMTDDNGYFFFTDVEAGKHSLTALSEDKAIGFISFALSNDSSSDVTLQEDGTYTVSIDKMGAGVDLHLVLSEENGTLTPIEASTIGNAEPTLSLWWVWLLLVAVAICIVVLVVYRRKKKAN